jgi:hypothetical protein
VWYPEAVGGDIILSPVSSSDERSCGSFNGGMTCRRYFDVEGANEEYVVVDVKLGLGDPLNVSVEIVGDAKADGEGDSTRGMAGKGVDTPKAFASFASRCGGRGVLGGAHVGDGDTGASAFDTSDDLGVPLALALTDIGSKTIIRFALLWGRGY